MHLRLVHDARRPKPRPAKVVQLDARREARREPKVQPHPPWRPAA
jgi:hypothetical protein